MENSNGEYNETLQLAISKSCGQAVAIHCLDMVDYINKVFIKLSHIHDAQYSLNDIC